MHGVFEIGCPIRRRRAALDRIGFQCRALGPALDRIGVQCRALGPALDRIGVQTRLECGPTWDHTACPCTVLDRPPLHWTPRCTQCTGCLKLAAQSGGEGLHWIGSESNAGPKALHWIGSESKQDWSVALPITIKHCVHLGRLPSMYLYSRSPRGIRASTGSLSKCIKPPF